MRAHEAGALHAQIEPPTWLRIPGDDVNALDPELWSRTVRKGDDGVLSVGGVAVTELAARFGTPLYVLDEADFRGRAQAFRRAFDEAFAPEAGLAGAQVYYAGKAFLCGEVARWADEEGLGLDTCTGGELAVALCAGLDPARLTLHGNNKLDADIDRAVRVGVGRLVVDNLEDVDRIAAAARAAGTRARVMVRVTTGVEAHTHEYIATAHEDQKFGLSLAGGQAFEAARRILGRPELELVGLHSHIGSQIFDTAGFEVAAERVLGLHARIAAEFGHTSPELDLGGGFGIKYTSEHTPLPADEVARRMAGIVAGACARLHVPVPHVSVEPGRAIVGPAMFTLYTVGAVKDVQLTRGSRRYVAVDGGMSDNVRTALYDADYSATLASRRSAAGPALSRVVGRHCESGDIVVKDEFLPADVRRGDLVAVPDTGAYCWALASNYNHVPRPGVVAVRDGAAHWVVRGETVDDLLARDPLFDRQEAGA